MRSSVLWREQLSRIFRIVLTLLGGRSLNAQELARLCEVSRRTIHRDLQSLIAVGVPIEYRPELRGYRINPRFAEQHPRLDLKLMNSLTRSPSYRVLIRVPSPILSELQLRFPRPLSPVFSTGNFPAEMRLEFATDGLEQAAAELLLFAESVEVLEPLELRERLRDIAGRIARRHAVNSTISDSAAVAG